MLGCLSKQKTSGRMPASEDFMKLSITSAYAQYEQDVAASAKACVEEGGGIWVGIQDCAPYTDLVLFNSPETGSTLALKTTAITPELVASKIKNSNAQFRRTK
jgi:hypothetical protein